MQLVLSISDGFLVLASSCEECQRPITDAIELDVAVERLRSAAGPAARAMMSAVLGNLELAIPPEGIVFFDVPWEELVAWCPDCALEARAAVEDAEVVASVAGQLRQRPTEDAGP